MPAALAILRRSATFCSQLPYAFHARSHAGSPPAAAPAYCSAHGAASGFVIGFAVPSPV